MLKRIHMISSVALPWKQRQELMIHVISSAVILGLCKRVYENTQKMAQLKKNASGILKIS